MSTDSCVAPSGRSDGSWLTLARAVFSVAALGLVALACAPAPPETRPVDSRSPAADVRPGAVQSTVSSSPSPETTTPISAIQGPGHFSPMVGQVLSTTGVITGIGDGVFFLESTTPDREDATSEGLRVAVPDFTVDGEAFAMPEVERGQRLRVTGRIEEIRGRDHDLPVTTLRLSDLGRALEALPASELPAPVRLLGDGRTIPNRIAWDSDRGKLIPDTDGVDFFEALEGMRVRVEDPLVVGATRRGGGLFMWAERGGGAPALHPRGGLLRREGDAKPSALYLDQGLGATPPTVDVGQGLGTVHAVVDYARGGYRLRLLEPVDGHGHGPTPETTHLRGDDSHLTLASFNVLNLAATDPPEKPRALARIVVDHLRAPDVLALQEIQDDSGGHDDGTVSADATYRVLIDAIRDAGGPAYAVRQLDPVNNADGGRPGGNIRTGFLFRPERVEAVDGTTKSPHPEPRFVSEGGRARLLPSPARLLHPAFDRDEGRNRSGTRKPLVAQFRFNGRDLFLINLHLRSKGGDDSPFGARRPPRRGSEEQRTEQAQAVAELVDSLLAVDPDARVMVIGDLNEHRNRPPLDILEKRLVNLVEDVPLEQRYTYIYRGQGQILDHVLVSPAVAEAASPEIDIVHTASEYAAAHQASDHEPLVVRLRFAP
ncbi:MAG: endonuclease/exonuclease/phosphatase family protein [Acidobacteriota bacterium]